MSIFSFDFWRAFGWTLVRTALAGLVPFLPGLLSDPAATIKPAGSTVALLLIVTIATSLRGIVDPTSASWWQVLTSRGLRQLGQFLAAGLVGAVLLSDVSWSSLLTSALASALSTVILAALTIIPGADAAVVIPGEVVPVPAAGADDAGE